MLKTTVRRSAKILSGLLLLSLLQACGEGEPTPANLALFAGDVGTTGSVDGAGTAARFNAPLGVAADSAGNIYVADTNNHTIRKIDSTGGVVTLAGDSVTQTSGNVNATGAAARFNLPSGVVTDSAGNVYVADTANHSIRKIDSAGAVTTLAGTTAPGNTNGGGSIARFNFPSGIAIDSAGILYVADTNNHMIRKIVVTAGVGAVTTLAGTTTLGSANGIGAAASFHFPNSITIDSLGNLYVADTGNHTIRKIVISTTGVATVSTLAGTALSTGSLDGTGAAARFDTPLGITTDSAGNVYVADTNNHTIRKITPAGETSTVVGVAGSAGFTPGFLPGQLSSPTGVAISGTSLYITTGNGVAVATRVP